MRKATPLARPGKARHIRAMGPSLTPKAIGLACAVAAGLALAVALGAENWGGLIPCPLCLLQRWPYRAAIMLGLLAIILPPRLARVLLVLAFAAFLTETALAATHVGVEQGWWQSPLPQCAAPQIKGGSLADRLAQLPARPAKPCDEPTYMIPGLPVSMALMNLVYASGCCVLLGAALALGVSAKRARTHELAG